MIDTQHTTSSDAARRQRRRIKQGLVATWIHEISARHGSAPAPVGERAVESAAAIDAAFPPRLDRITV